MRAMKGFPWCLIKACSLERVGAWCVQPRRLDAHRRCCGGFSGVRRWIGRPDLHPPQSPRL